MTSELNPYEPATSKKQMSKQTAEIRSGDGSADIYLYMAGLIIAIQHGISMKDADKVAEELYVGVNIFKEEHKKVREKLKQLPASC